MVVNAYIRMQLWFLRGRIRRREQRIQRLVAELREMEHDAELWQASIWDPLP